MKGLKKLVLVSAIAAAPLAAQAELKAVDDAVLADVSGQSGLVIEAGFGSLTYSDIAVIADSDWDTDAGIHIDAFKWEVDVEAWDSASNATLGASTGALGGFIAKDISINGSVDVTIDALADAATLGTTNLGGIGITFANSDINMRVGDMGVYLNQTGLGQVNSMGAVEIIGMNLDGLELVVHGN
ncbi:MULTISPECIES: DUF6160 family protein [unclassified Hahella]|uniref:DUF6160 family protein n=1 Tax=unclassified Hahella TaxID=2624107 RepID=UPI000FDD0A2D|nr:MULTISPECIES: DUF6160 family protein [unclassified Hahella]AZZ93050.1 hypothetical protein ENC22_18280 [Hahella sp. KA22]MBU6950543.1 hypothetical protein [Hahella sp. HN01]MDG9667916.1 DUF6160 family protein [Hahella sp. CR1]QAY56424.1 hypothetical protein EUZ85_20865 [Hahella sp. KA22]